MDGLEDQAILKNTGLTDILRLSQDPNSDIKVTPQAKNGIKDFLDLMTSMHSTLAASKPSQVIEQLIKKIKYRDYLIKEEGSETLADEKYENIGQLINMAEKYVETGEDALRQFMEEVALLADISENEQGEIDAVKLMTVHSSK